jgi:hypothetical protein
LVVVGFGCQKGTTIPVVVGIYFWPSRQKPMTTKQLFAFVVVKSLRTYDTLSKAIVMT